MRGVVHIVLRFFGLPRGVPRRPTSAADALLPWCLSAALGAGFTALGWADTAVSVMVVLPVLYMLDEVAKGVRNGRPAFVLAMAAGWGTDRLAFAVLPYSFGPWQDCAVFALATAVALAAFVIVSRLPGRRSRAGPPSAA